MKTTINADLMKRLPEGRDMDVWDEKLPGFVLRVRASGRHSYRLNYARGKWYTIGKVGAMKPHQARQQATVLLGRVAGGEDLQAAAKRAKAATLRDFLRDVDRPWAKANRKTGEAMTNRLLSCLGNEIVSKRLPNVSPWLVDKWRTRRLKSGIAPSTVNREIAALKASLNRAVRWGVIDANPLAAVKPVKTDKNPVVRFLSAAEEKRLRKALAARDEAARKARRRANAWRRARDYSLMPEIPADGYADHLTPLVLIALNTGMRRGELFNLLWADVALKRRIATVRGQGAKSATTRHIPLNDEAVNVLKRWGPGEGLVFPGEDGRRLTSVKTAWAGLMSAAGIVNFRFHDTRHHFASRLVMAGVDLNTTRELLGHASLDMTLRYAHLAPDHKAAAVAVLGNE